MELQADFGVHAADLTRSVDGCWKDGAEPQELNTHPTPLRYQPHLDALMKAGILEQLSGTADLRFINGYFSIPKDASSERAILNGKRLSRLFNPPAPVNLQPVTEVFELLITIVSLIATSGVLFAYGCDLRHWFHQIRVAPSVSRFFGLHCGNVYYHWTTLPMGWGWSPRICQCLAWTLLLWNKDVGSNDDGLRIARKDARSSLDPPRFVYLHNDQGSRVGFLTLTYDNVFVVSTDVKIGLAFKKKLERNFALACVVVKDSSVHLAGNEWSAGDQTLHRPAPLAQVDPLVDASGSDFGIAHLGVQYSLFLTNERWSVRWRHEPARTKKWMVSAEELKNSSGSPTRRFVARICGIIIWHYTILRRPLCFASPLIDLMRTISVPERRLWDESIDITPLQQGYLAEELGLALKNEWVMGKPPPETTNMYLLFSDASKRRMGGIFCSEVGTNY